DFQFEVEMPSWKDPSPAPFVGGRVTVCEPPNEFRQDSGIENQRGYFAPESCGTVERQFVLVGEIVEARVSEIVTMRWIRESVRAGIMRNGDVNPGLISRYTMDFFHRPQ